MAALPQQRNIRNPSAKVIIVWMKERLGIPTSFSFKKEASQYRKLRHTANSFTEQVIAAERLVV